MNTLLSQLSDAIVDMDEHKAHDVAQQIVESKLNLFDAIEQSLVGGMERVGELFEKEEYFITELLVCADVMNVAMDIFKPHINYTQKKSKGRIVIGSIFGDTHDIGKNIVALILSSSGFDVLDLGRDVSPKKFVDSAVEFNADIIAISTLMTTTMNNMEDVIILLKERSIRNKFRVIIGGKPCSLNFAKKIGADGYSSSAGAALRLVKGILNSKEANE